MQKKKAAIMAAFFYFSRMETLRSLYNQYDEYINGNQLSSDYEEFQLQTYSIYPEAEIKHLDLSTKGKMFTMWMKRTSQDLSSKFLPRYLSEVKLSPDIKFFYNKHIKKITDIKEQLALKFPDWIFFQTDIDEALEELEVFLNTEEKQINSNVGDRKTNSHKIRIKWLPTRNVLTTFFFDLLNGQDKGSPLIEATVDDIKRLLINNFVDSDGKEFSKDTLDTYLRPDRVEKKAKRGDRIELGNVKQKNRL
jgi:uncharacterized protein Smg (DUF494 family)